MLEQLNRVLKKVFTNEETIVFSIAILLFFIVISFFGSVLTPFIISIIVAYLLVGLQKKIQSFNVNQNIALVITFSIFIITGAALLVWLVPIGASRIWKIQGGILGIFLEQTDVCKN